MRTNDRDPRQVRPVKLTPGYSRHAEGSCLVEFGDTKVICTATVEDKVPPHVMGSGGGWVTAEYGMLPRSTHTRSAREAARGKQGGRTLEIQRLIGRAMRAAVDPKDLGIRTIALDCDVLQADGGTRTASITGAYVALAQAVGKLIAAGSMKRTPVLHPVAAVSVGICKGELRLDLDYEEDSKAEVDLNVAAVRESSGGVALVEVQGTAEGKPFSRQQLDGMLDLALEGIAHLITLQDEALREVIVAGPKATRLVLATRNPGKLRELAALCQGALELVSVDELPGAPEVVEDGETFADNARKKAVALAAFSGLPALADDSGLCVDALGGRPGVLSARYAPGSDDDRITKLLFELEGVQPGQRGAHFTCALCLALDAQTAIEVEGTLRGEIALARRGAGGFGYDPVFQLPSGATLGETDAMEKNRTSHRAVALAMMRPHLDALLVRSDLPRSSGVG